MRLTDEELAKVKEKYNVDELWSYSRFDTYRISPYLYYLKYVKKEKPMKDSVSPYGIIGNAVHDILEKYYRGELKYNEMYDAFVEEYMMQIELFELKFNNTDEKLNSSIANKYKTDMEHFFKNYKPIDDYTHKMEQYLVTEIQPGIVFNGYLDDVYKDADGIYTITDYKTSSKSGFTGEGLKNHASQLVIYSKALEQMGVASDKIKARFNMLRYVSVFIDQKNGTKKESVIERCQIGEKLQSKAKVWLKAEGYSEDDMNDYLTQMFETNSIDCLPDNVKAHFEIRDCYIDIIDPLSLYDDLRKEIIDTLSEIDNRMHEFKDKNYDDSVWWDDDSLLEKNSYYHVQISDYTLSQHKPFFEWCKKFEEEKQANNDLLGVSNKAVAVDDSNDMSWINNL